MNITLTIEQVVDNKFAKKLEDINSSIEQCQNDFNKLDEDTEKQFKETEDYLRERFLEVHKDVLAFAKSTFNVDDEDFDIEPMVGEDEAECWCEFEAQKDGISCTLNLCVKLEQDSPVAVKLKDLETQRKNLEDKLDDLDREKTTIIDQKVAARKELTKYLVSKINEQELDEIIQKFL